MADLFARQALTLNNLRLSQSTLTIDLDPQTEWIEVAIARPTSVSTGIVWDATATIGVSIQVLLDGQLYEASGRSTGGIRSANGSEITNYRLRWHLPCGYFGGTSGKRLGETRASTYQVRVTLSLLRGSTVTTTVLVTAASAPLTLETRHNSVAYDNAASAIEESGDGVLSFSITSTGSQRAALVAVGSRGTALDGTLAITGGGETIGSTLWDVTSGVSINSRGYPITNQATGAQTLTSDLTATSTTDHFLGIVTMTGVNQSAPTGNVAAVAPAFDASPVSCTVTGVAAADLVVDFLICQIAPTVGANQTERVTPGNTGFPTWFRMSTQSGADGGVMSWTHTGDISRGMNAVVFKAQPSAALTGTATASITEDDIVAGGKTIIVTLTDDTYVPASSSGASPTVRGVGAFGSGTTSFTAAVPTAGNAPQAGDAMYIIMESTDSTTGAGTPTTPGTWSKLFENTIAAGASVEPAVSTLTIFGKIAGASESNVTINGVGNHCAGAMIVVAGHGLSAITDTVVGSATDHGTSTANILAPSINVTAGSLILICMGLGDDANDTTNVSGVVNANLASITERIDQTVSTGSGGGVGIYTATCAGTSTGTTEWDHDTAASSQSLQLGIPPVLTTPFADARQDFIDGFDSAQSEGTGWNAEVRDKAAVTEVVRTSDTVATWTIAAQAGYNITAQEVITGTIPASILTGGGAIVATPTFTIDPSGGAPAASLPPVRARHPMAHLLMR